MRKEIMEVCRQWTTYNLVYNLKRKTRKNKLTSDKRMELVYLKVF